MLSVHGSDSFDSSGQTTQTPEPEHEPGRRPDVEQTRLRLKRSSDPLLGQLDSVLPAPVPVLQQGRVIEECSGAVGALLMRSVRPAGGSAGGAAPTGHAMDPALRRCGAAPIGRAEAR